MEPLIEIYGTLMPAGGQLNSMHASEQTAAAPATRSTRCIPHRPAAVLEAQQQRPQQVWYML
jgi:hypothetical protein